LADGFADTAILAFVRLWYMTYEETDQMYRACNYDDFGSGHCVYADVVMSI